MRTIVSIPDKQAEILDRICHEAHISRTELIRRSITYYIEAHLTPKIQERAFGLLKGQINDGLDYQENIRSEWE